MEVDLILGRLADPVAGRAEVKATGRPADRVKGEDGALVGEAVLHTGQVPRPHPAPLHHGPGVPVHLALQADARPAPHHDLPVRRLRLDPGGNWNRTS